MDPISVILLAVRGLSVVVNNPALGGGSSLRMQEISSFLDILGELIERGDEGHEELQRFADTVERMAKEGRPPTPAEWDVLKGRSDAAHAIIQEAAAQLDEDEVIADEEADASRAELEAAGLPTTGPDEMDPDVLDPPQE